jgi:hypothetical protein
MAKVRETAARTVKRAKATAAQVRRRGQQLAKKVSDKVTGRARKRKRAKVAAALVGAAAVATAAGIGIARKRKR